MTRDLCDISLQQTRELVRLTESTLQKICVKEFSRQELYVDALRKVLGGKGRRGPRSIFIVSLEE
ncbi:MAG TPA: HD family phosphohydrolase, partial [Geobacterales bacterium]|nr:HD family phosphohydrolase [Geobacterales bacterium]